jgi:predicted transglutaminase-like protease
MAFSTFCTNKGCGKIQEPYLDPQTNKVHCSLCDQEIVNLTPFVKSQMKSMKQYKKKEAKPFAVKCAKCGREERPKVVANDIVCGVCSQPMDNLSPIFKNMLKEKLRTADKDV